MPSAWCRSTQEIRERAKVIFGMMENDVIPLDYVTDHHSFSLSLPLDGYVQINNDEITQISQDQLHSSSFGFFFKRKLCHEFHRVKRTNERTEVGQDAEKERRVKSHLSAFFSHSVSLFLSRSILLRRLIEVSIRVGKITSIRFLSIDVDKKTTHLEVC